MIGDSRWIKWGSPSPPPLPQQIHVYVHLLYAFVAKDETTHDLNWKQISLFHDHCIWYLWYVGRVWVFLIRSQTVQLCLQILLSIMLQNHIAMKMKQAYLFYSSIKERICDCFLSFLHGGVSMICIMGLISKMQF